MDLVNMMHLHFKIAFTLHKSIQKLCNKAVFSPVLLPSVVSFPICSQTHFFRQVMQLTACNCVQPQSLLPGVVRVGLYVEYEWDYMFLNSSNSDLSAAFTRTLYIVQCHWTLTWQTFCVFPQSTCNTL